MNSTIDLNTPATVWKVTGAGVDLYAAQKPDSAADNGRLFHFMSLAPGSVFVTPNPAETADCRWYCVAKCTFGAALIPVSDTDGDIAATTDDFNASFAAFTADLEDSILYESLLYPIKKMGAVEMMDSAIENLVHVNQKISKVTEELPQHEPEAVKVCRRLCKYLKTPVKIPAGELYSGNDQLIEEILHLSGIRFKNSLLKEGWWKQESGPLLATYKDDIPVVLLPHPVSGYQMYNSRSDETCRVTGSIADQIQPGIRSVYRTLPARPLKLPDIWAFVASENIAAELIKVFFFSILAALVQLFPPIMSAQIFDSVIPGGQYAILAQLVFITLSFEIANIGFSVLLSLGLTRINIKWDVALGAAIWDRLLNLKIAFFHQYTTGELLGKITGINNVLHTISPAFMSNVLTSLFALVNIYILFRFIPAIAPYTLLLFVAALLVSVIVWRAKYQLKSRQVALSGRIMSMNHQIIRSMERIKISAAEERIFGMWSTMESESRYLQGQISSLDNALKSFYQFYQFAAIAIVYLLIFWRGSTGTGSFIAFISAYMVLQRAVLGLLKSLNVVPEMLPVIRDFSPLLESVPEYAEEKIIPKELDGSLEVNHVSFQYAQYAPPVLHDISFHLAPGESLGIIGASGSGKSTLLKLLFGFYEPTAGKIYISGNDLQTLDLRYLRQHMSIVLQAGSLTVGSIYSNIVDNNPLVTADDVAYAIKVAALEADIAALPDGLHTRLDDSGHLFSMDQKQKLLIARAVARRQPYFLLDEATSSFDSITQAAIMENLSHFSATKIIIAQRLSTLKHCDRILVFEHGRIKQEGSYQDIIGQNN